MIIILNIYISNMQLSFNSKYDFDSISLTIKFTTNSFNDFNRP